LLAFFKYLLFIQYVQALAALRAEMGLTLDQLRLLYGRFDAQKKKMIVEEM